jgi:hypothetical protein
LGCNCTGIVCEPSSKKCSGTCTTGHDCGSGCTCVDYQCVPCDAFPCDPDECSSKDTCKCEGGACVGDGNGGGQCPDSVSIEIDDDNCHLVGKYETESCCGCPGITLNVQGNRPDSTDISYKLDFIVEARKGAYTGNINILPLLGDNSNPNIADNEEAIAGRVSLSGVTTYNVLDANGHRIRTETVAMGVQSESFPGTGDVDTLTGYSLTLLKIGFQDNLLSSTSETWIVRDHYINFDQDVSMRFPNDCVYEPTVNIGTYYIKSDADFLAFDAVNMGNVVANTLKSRADICRKVLFNWSKDGNLFRSFYVSKDESAAEYVDTIYGPAVIPANGILSEAANNGELSSCRDYLLEVDCGCAADAYEADVVFCNPGASDISVEFIDCTTVEVIFPEPCPVNDNLDKYGLPAAGTDVEQVEYILYFNGSEVDRWIGKKNKTYIHNESVDTVEIKMNCDSTGKCDLLWSNDVLADIDGDPTLDCKGGGFFSATFASSYGTPAQTVKNVLIDGIEVLDYSIIDNLIIGQTYSYVVNYNTYCNPSTGEFVAECCDGLSPTIDYPCVDVQSGGDIKVDPGTIDESYTYYLNGSVILASDLETKALNPTDIIKVNNCPEETIVSDLQNGCCSGLSSICTCTCENGTGLLVSLTSAHYPVQLELYKGLDVDNNLLAPLQSPWIVSGPNDINQLSLPQSLLEVNSLYYVKVIDDIGCITTTLPKAAADCCGGLTAPDYEIYVRDCGYHTFVLRDSKDYNTPGPYTYSLVDGTGTAVTITNGVEKLLLSGSQPHILSVTDDNLCEVATIEVPVQCCTTADLQITYDSINSKIIGTDNNGNCLTFNLNDLDGNLLASTTTGTISLTVDCTTDQGTKYSLQGTGDCEGCTSSEFELKDCCSDFPVVIHDGCDLVVQTPASCSTYSWRKVGFDTQELITGTTLPASLIDNNSSYYVIANCTCAGSDVQSLPKLYSGCCEIGISSAEIKDCTNIKIIMDHTANYTITGIGVNGSQIPESTYNNTNTMEIAALPDDDYTITIAREGNSECTVNTAYEVVAGVATSAKLSVDTSGTTVLISQGTSGTPDNDCSIDVAISGSNCLGIYNWELWSGTTRIILATNPSATFSIVNGTVGDGDDVYVKIKCASGCTITSNTITLASCGCDGVLSCGGFFHNTNNCLATIDFDGLNLEEYTEWQLNGDHVDRVNPKRSRSFEQCSDAINQNAITKPVPGETYTVKLKKLSDGGFGADQCSYTMPDVNVTLTDDGACNITIKIQNMNNNDGGAVWIDSFDIKDSLNNPIYNGTVGCLDSSGLTFTDTFAAPDNETYTINVFSDGLSIFAGGMPPSITTSACGVVSCTGVACPECTYCDNNSGNCDINWTDGHVLPSGNKCCNGLSEDWSLSTSTNFADVSIKTGAPDTVVLHNVAWTGATLTARIFTPIATPTLIYGANPGYVASPSVTDIGGGDIEIQIPPAYIANEGSTGDFWVVGILYFEVTATSTSGCSVTEIWTTFTSSNPPGETCTTFTVSNLSHTLGSGSTQLEGYDHLGAVTSPTPTDLTDPHEVSITAGYPSDIILIEWDSGGGDSFKTFFRAVQSC